MSNAAIIRLQRAGFSEDQVDALAGLMDEQLATKADLHLVHWELKNEIVAVRSELKNEIVAVRSELKNNISSVRADIEILKRDLTIRLGGMIVIGFGAMAGLFTFLSRLPGHL